MKKRIMIATVLTIAALGTTTAFAASGGDVFPIDFKGNDTVITAEGSDVGENMVCLTNKDGEKFDFSGNDVVVYADKSDENMTALENGFDLSENDVIIYGGEKMGENENMTEITADMKVSENDVVIYETEAEFSENTTVIGK